MSTEAEDDMAGGMDLGTGGRSRRKPLDATINLVPFIDLMAVTISFLIMTAVWTQVSRLQVATAGGEATAARNEADLDLAVVVTERGLVVTAGGVALAELPKGAHGHDFAALSARLADVRRQHPEQRQVTVHSADHIPYGDLIRTIDACAGEGLDAITVALQG